MIVFPNCKINLGLQVTGRRADGFHNINSLMYPLALSDCLEVIESPDKQTHFSSSGLEVPPDGKQNLCLQAWQLLKEKYDIPNVSIHLYKRIPIGSGLGGGSSDAAATLKVINVLFDLQLNDDILKNLASELGSDCAFFIDNKPAVAYGRGEILKRSTFSLSGYNIIIVVPQIHISTKEAYSGIKKYSNPWEKDFMHNKSIEHVMDTLSNDFETHIFEKHPGIETIKNRLYKMGAIYASMSGSGSSVFGIFRDEDAPDLSHLSDNVFVWKERMK